MQIRKTVLSDLPRVMAIYDHARKFMAANGNPRQWNTTWPPEELIRSDIAAGKSYVCVETREAGITQGNPSCTSGEGDSGCGERQTAAGRQEEKEAPAEEILAVFYYACAPHAEPGYDHLEGTWTGSETYGGVHRIATSGNGKGVGSYCIQWAYSQCHNLRMDTHPDNKVMQHTLLKNGFIYRGIVHVEEDNDPRYAYEKLG